MRLIDLYCGAGFGASGAVSAGAEPILAVDSWSLAAINYKYNFPNSHVISAKAEQISPKRIASHLSCDILISSPECTSHSIASGSKPGSEISRETAINTIPWIEAFNPPWVIIENVVRMRQWERHAELKTYLQSIGYNISELVLNAVDFGVPQKRKRLFLICGLYSDTPNEQDFKTYNSAKRSISVRQILDFSGTWTTTPLYTKNRAQNTLERAERAIFQLGSRAPFLIVYYGSDYAGGWQPLDVPLRTITTLDRFALVTWEKNEYRIRMLQPPELIKAMGAPKNYKLYFGNRREKVKLCGNGICSPVMEAIFTLIKRKQAQYINKKFSSVYYEKRKFRFARML